MNVRFLKHVTFSVLFMVFAACSCDAQDADVPASQGLASESLSFSKMPGDQVRTELLQWLARTEADSDVLERITREWADNAVLEQLSGEALLDRLVHSFAEVDKATERLLAESYGSGPVETLVFDGIRDVSIFKNQMQQFRARWLAQHRYYDEALGLLNELDPEDVVDPAGLLFYRAVCQAELLQRNEAIDSLTLLLHNTLDVPDRFRVVAEMLEKDLEDQKDDGMSRVEKLMQDVQRRLDLGRSGEKTQQQEGAVIEELDRILEQMEQQKNQQQGGGGGGTGQQTRPGQQGANQPRLQGATGEGKADRKNLTEKGRWGMLDKQAEAKARELIRQKLPSNFLDQISRYTRRIAEQKK